jgi:hypothetical protein
LEISLLTLFIFTVVFVAVAVYIGILIGRHNQAEGVAQITGSAVGAILGLLAFILAFTFNMAAGQYDQRKQELLQEIGIIKTAYLRAGLLPEAAANDARSLLREYVDVRVAISRQPESLQAGLARSDEINRELWALIQNQMSIGPPSITHSLFAQAVNDVISSHTRRVNVALNIRIPASIWVGLYIIAGFGMIMVGYQFGQAKRGSLIVAGALALAFSTVILLIADLDRAIEGTVQVNQQPLYDLQAYLEDS